MSALRIVLAAVVICLGSARPAQGQQGPVREVLTATSDVHDVAVAGERVLLATSGGLVVRRGGRVERVVGAGQGLPGARLRSVSVTEEGAWVGGVEGAALVSLDATAPRVLRALPLRRVRRVVRFAGALWIATYGDGLFRLPAADGAPEAVPLGRHHALSRITDLAVLDGSLWVSTAGSGVLRLSPEGVMSRLRTGLPDPMVWDLSVDGERLLAGTLGGVGVIVDGRVARRARESIVTQRLPVRDVRAVLPSPAGTWVAVWGGGVYRLPRNGTRAASVSGDPAREARALAAGEGGVLVAHAAGLGRVDGRGRLRAEATGGLPSADVTALASAFGALWVGTFDQGLARVRGGRVIAERRALERWGLDRRINDLAATRDGRGRETLWIATDRGLWFHDGRRYAPVLDANAPGTEHVTSLHVDGDGALWVTSSRQLARLRQGHWRSWTGDARFPVMQLHSVTTTRDGAVWVGSLHGLFRFDPESGRFARHTVSSGDLPVDWVTAVLPWGDGVVAGTYHGGLSWHDGERFRIEREGPGGLPAGWVNPHAMRWVDGALWIGTLERGLVVGRTGAWTHLGVDDGLPSDDVTDILPAGDGTVWVATRGGLARVESLR